MNFNTTPDYHAQAAKCMEWAERATDREAELHWLSMAQAYLALAGALENENLNDVWGDASLLDMDNGVSPTRH
jgi:hypothetical protein